MTTQLLKKIGSYAAFILIFLQMVACKKFLDEKPNQQLAIPETLADAQALMDYYSIFNGAYPTMGDQSDDNFYTTTDRFNAWTLYQQQLYVWAADPVSDLEYSNVYRVILSSNIALETLQKISRTDVNAAQWDQVKGTGLFYRSFALYNAAQYFAAPYDPATAAQLPGVPLRSGSEPNEIISRAGMQETWEHIVEQLEQAIPLLPVFDIIPSRPNRAAALAMLARVQLAMHNYAACRDAAKQSLQLYHELINFNTLNANAASPFTRFNKEVLFPAIGISASQLTPTNYAIDTTLFNSYHVNDLRRTVYFRNNNFGGKSFKANLNGSATGAPFCGIATDEVYLMFAEAAARTGQWQQGLDSLNSLLKTRWMAGTFVPFAAGTEEEAIQLILSERRKEMILRGTRWMDLRRLSTEPSYAITPKRIIANTIYLLPPGSKRYTFLFPLQTIQLTGIAQNER